MREVCQISTKVLEGAREVQDRMQGSRLGKFKVARKLRLTESGNHVDY